jgi:hypothetical protein
VTTPEYALIVIFAAIWIVPLAMSLLWERRYRVLRRRLREGGEPAERDARRDAPHVDGTVHHRGAEA